MKRSRPRYLSIVSHYEQCLEQYGDTYRGVDWPKPEDATIRYRVMLELIRKLSSDETVRLLDFGCGTAHLLEYIHTNGLDHLDYSGLDISRKFTDVAQRKFPNHRFYCGDILQQSDLIPSFDYVVMNGVFTEKHDLSFDQMLDYMKSVLSQVWLKTNRGLAFNVMSKHVDWERKDLFHLPFDLLADFVAKSLSRNFVIRNDYGLYEYTTYIYRR